MNPTQSQPVPLLASSLFAPDFQYVFDHPTVWMIWFEAKCQMVKSNSSGMSGHAFGSLFRLFFQVGHREAEPDNGGGRRSKRGRAWKLGDRTKGSLGLVEHRTKRKNQGKL